MTKRSRIALSVGLVGLAVVFGAARATTLGHPAILGVFVAVVGLIVFLAWRIIGSRVEDDNDDHDPWRDS